MNGQRQIVNRFHCLLAVASRHAHVVEHYQRIARVHHHTPAMFSLATARNLRTGAIDQKDLTRRRFHETSRLFATLTLGALSLSRHTVAPTAFARHRSKFARLALRRPAAPYFVALDKGYYKAGGLDVTIDTGNGSD